MVVATGTAYGGAVVAARAWSGDAIEVILDGLGLEVVENGARQMGDSVAGIHVTGRVSE